MTLATDSQKRYIISLLRKSNFRDQTRPEGELVKDFEERFGFSFPILTHEQASMAIDNLKKKGKWVNRNVYGGWLGR